MLGDVVEHVRDGTAGRYSVDGDLLLTGVLRQDLDKGRDGCLGAGVERVAGHAVVEGSVTRHQDDPASFVHVTVGFTGNKELSAGVEAEHAIEFLLRHVLEVPEAHHTRIGAHNIETAEMGDGIVH